MTLRGRPVGLPHGSSSLKSDQRHPEGLPAFQPEPAGGRGQRADQHCRRPLLLQRRRPAGTTAPRAGQAALGALTAGGASPGTAHGGYRTQLCGVWTQGRAIRCGQAAPALGQRTACTPVSSSFSLLGSRLSACFQFGCSPGLPSPLAGGVPTLLPRLECTSLGRKLFGLQGEGLLRVYHPVSHVGQGMFSVKAQGVNILAKFHPSNLLKK